MGKRQFALAAGVSLLCEQPRQGLACGQCTACQWLASGNHPDFRRIRPEAIAIEEGADQDGSDTVAKKAPSKEIRVDQRSEEHTSELQSLMRISYAVFCLKKKNNQNTN